MKIILNILYHTSETEFTDLLNTYLKKCLRSGYPSLYNDIMALCTKTDPMNPLRRVYATDAYDLKTNKTIVITLNLVNSFIENLIRNGTFVSTPDESDPMEVPTCLMWTYYLRAHIQSVLGNLENALNDINLAVVHTPTGLDCIVRRARILKTCGDYSGAAVNMDYCRSLDLQDRYLNNKATKYFLRANKIPNAMDTIAMFTKHDGDPQQSLFDLQCVWYELECGEAFARTEQWGQSLKKFYAVESQFLDFIEDQFDFHSFCLRKVLLIN
jgi:peptide alpha-N-acetyltransferase